MDVKGEQLMRKLICAGHEREGCVSQVVLAMREVRCCSLMIANQNISLLYIRLQLCYEVINPSDVTCQSYKINLKDLAVSKDHIMSTDYKPME